MTTFIKKKLKDREGSYLVTPSSADIVYCSDGETVATKLRKVENDEFSPTITQMSSVSKVGVGEDIDISDNTQEGYLKSAILSGNTLVNLMTNCKDEYVVKYHSIDDPNNIVANISMMKPNTEYTLFYKAKYRTVGEGAGTNGSLKIATSIEQGFIFTNQSLTTEYKQYVYRFTTSSVVDCFVFSTTDKYFAIKECVLLEGDHTEEDIPFFEGMQSVKMPVLRTTGKNLFDYSSHPITLEKLAYADGQQVYWVGYIGVKTYVPVKENTTYTYSNDINVGIYFGLVFYDDDKSVLSYINNFKTNNSFTSFTTPKGCKFIRFAMETQTIPQWIQLEEATSPTPYEPYKSNILSTPSDLELRGVGDVKDELNYLTGQVTERIGEAILNGSQGVSSWWNTTSTIGVSIPIPTMKNISKLNCDKLPVVSHGAINNDTYDKDGIASWDTGNIIRFRIEKSKLTTEDVDGVKQYLQQNPITIQYELATPIIKTVDLTPGGTNPTTKPYVWDGGHIQLSSEEGSLTPSLEYSVTTSRGGQIIQNTQSIAKQDKRVYDLEMLLINASIDEAYKRLTLQNEVMVSYNEELKVNPIRYYMLSRLIEEEMYQESDMLDKLDAFFLYGEINTEQYYGLSEAIVGDNAIATLDEVIASHEIQVDIPTTLEEEVLPSDRPTTLEEQPIVEEVEGTPVVELKDCSKTYTLLMNKLELSIQRVEDLAHYVGLANAYICANRLSYEEYELVIARIENAHISLH